MRNAKFADFSLPTYHYDYVSDTNNGLVTGENGWEDVNTGESKFLKKTGEKLEDCKTIGSEIGK